jgi:hypothetical protein
VLSLTFLGRVCPAPGPGRGHGVVELAVAQI